MVRKIQYIINYLIGFYVNFISTNNTWRLGLIGEVIFIYRNSFFFLKKEKRIRSCNSEKVSLHMNKSQIIYCRVPPPCSLPPWSLCAVQGALSFPPTPAQSTTPFWFPLRRKVKSLGERKTGLIKLINRVSVKLTDYEYQLVVSFLHLSNESQ